MHYPNLVPEGPRWLQVAGWSDLGKTTILASLIARATARGERVTAVKFSEHPVAPDRGDSGRFAAAGADHVAWVGADGAVWRGPGSDLLRWLATVEGDWVMVEGGRMLPTLKILLADGEWPAYRPPVAAGIGMRPGSFPVQRTLRLPHEAEEAAAWIDRHRIAWSMPALVWQPSMAHGSGHD